MIVISWRTRQYLFPPHFFFLPLVAAALAATADDSSASVAPENADGQQKSRHSLYATRNGVLKRTEMLTMSSLPLADIFKIH